MNRNNQPRSGNKDERQRPALRHRSSSLEDSRRSDDVSFDIPDPSSTRARFHPDLFAKGDEGAVEEESLSNWVVDFVLGAAAVWISFGLLTVVVLLYTFVLPFSVTVYRRLVNQIGAGSYLEAISLLLPNTRICLTGDSDVLNPVGTSILVSNHVMNADWYSLLALGRCVGLRGSFKVFLRNEIFRFNKHSHREASGVTSGSSPLRKCSSLPSTGALTEDNNPTNARNHSISNSNSIPQKAPSPYLVLAAKFFNIFLEFPLIDEEGYVSDREGLFKLLRSFTDGDGTTAPVHFLLFPEGWSLYNGESRNTVLARSNGFAKREGRPQLKHLLLPRTTGFNASISSLHESSPTIYDLTIAYSGYKGCVPPEKYNLSLLSLWNTLRRRSPEEVHIRIKRYSMEEVLRDASWLDKKWAEKDRMLQYFSRHNCFPTDSRGFCRHQLFETRFQSVETSVMSFLRLALLPWTLPILFFLSIPIVWTTFVAWLFYKGYQYTCSYPEDRTTSRSQSSNLDEADENTGNSSRGTPFMPTTPFASPSISTWHDMLMDNVRDRK
mmetsp:Transcript_8716/g.18840  ORF Transcript_8716/g.18840 Transcript_8716/m.18840 type:complete len:552 (-) Transcript_8716:40-1695(-)